MLSANGLVKFKSVWEFKTNIKFNCICFGCIFSESQPTIITCHENGEVNFYSLPNKEQQILKTLDKYQPDSTLESKGGPIQVAVIEDVTRLHKNDLIIGDTKGNITIFCNHQILRRKVLSDYCIQCMKVQKDALGNVSMLTGDKSGQISCFTPYTDLWKLRLSDITPVKLQDSTKAVAVKSILPVDLTNIHGQVTNYVLATDDTKHLYFIQNGMVVKVISTPSLITSMCAGRFVPPEDFDTGDGQAVYDTQVALASDTGAIYIMSNFEVYTEEYANIQVPISQLNTLKAADTQYTDTLLCCGAFNGLSVVREGKEFGRYKTDCWVESMATGDVNGDGADEVILGCQNRTVVAVQLVFS